VRPALGERLAQGGQQVVRHLRGSAPAQPAQLVGDGRVGEALEQCLLVVGEVDAIGGRQERGDLVVHQRGDVRGEDAVGHDVVDGPVPGQ
jgi:hypothetical protein